MTQMNETDAAVSKFHNVDFRVPYIGRSLFLHNIQVVGYYVSH